MADDRDTRTPKTPPPAVQEQLAPPSRADSQFGTDELTPVFGDPVMRIEKRARDAAGASRGAFAAIREVRAEMKDAHRELGSRADKLSDKIGEIQGDLGDLKGSVGELSGKMDVIVNGYQATQQALIETTTFKLKTDTDVDAHREKAELEIKTTREKANIEDQKEEKSHRRMKVSTMFKILAAIAGAVAAAVGAMQC